MERRARIRQWRLSVSLWDIAFMGICFAFAFRTPLTKVEESFNMQATHDILTHGFDVSKFDHLSFPGVVPRTFVGPLLLSLASGSILRVLAVVGVTPDSFPPPRAPISQLLVRTVLGVWSVYCLRHLRMAVAARFSRTIAHCFALLTCVQFHVLFYATRTLPNVFALGFTNLALAKALHPRESFYSAIGLLSAACALFRSELCILIVTTIVSTVLFSPMRPTSVTFYLRVLKTGILAAIAVASVSIIVDSYFWGRLSYPELEVFYFNVILNKSSAWGTEPWHWYFTRALPKALGGSFILLVIGVLACPRDVPIAVVPSLAFVAIYSFLPHKELRFIFYALPACNIGAAAGLSVLLRFGRAAPRHPSSISTGMKIAVRMFGFACVLSSLVLTAMSAQAAECNYPGGQALLALQARENSSPCASVPRELRVHIDGAAAETGVTQFLERADGGGNCDTRKWVYSREEKLDPGVLHQRFTHLVTALEYVEGFTGIIAQEAYDGFKLRPWPPQISVRTAPKIFVHEIRSS